MEKLIEKLYSLSSHWDSIERIQLYYLLINIPMIFVGVASVVYHRSLVGIEISLNLDEIQVLLITGYICWTEESRQTPLRGFVFFRDVGFLLGAFAILGNLYYSGGL